MTLEERAASMTREEIRQLLVAHEELQSRYESLSRQLSWLKEQLFGRKSERRLVDVEGETRQLFLGELPGLSPGDPEPVVRVPAHDRRRRVEREESGSALRFDAGVEIEEIVLPPPVKEGERCTVIGEKVTHRLAQRPGSYVVLRYRRPVVKREEDGKIFCAPAPADVLGKSVADVSLVAGVALEKFLYHLPLYRQEQRLRASGIRVSRSTLLRVLKEGAELLAPVYEALRKSVLSSGTVTMDETPVRAGRSKRGKMHRGWFWPIWGDRGEVVFPYAPTRAHRVVEELLAGFSGVLQTDGYRGYLRYAEATAGLIHAQCWAHARRKFVQGREAEPELCDRALDLIGELYREEEQLREKGLSGEALLSARQERCRPVVEKIFSWLEQERRARVLLPSDPFVQAAEYVLSRREGLKVFLEHPDVPLDTNHLEREIRPLALGRKNWLFCWNEVGARVVTVWQSLIASCRLQGIDPRTYLIDVLQRLQVHPASAVDQLIPRLWKERFADQPLRSDVDRPPSPARQD